MAESVLACAGDKHLYTVLQPYIASLVQLHAIRDDIALALTSACLLHSYQHQQA